MGRAWKTLPLAVPMVAGAVVLCGDTAWVSIGAEAVGAVLLILTFLFGLAQVGGTQGNFTELAYSGEMSQKTKSVFVLDEVEGHFLCMTCSLPSTLSSRGSLMPQDTNFFRMTCRVLHDMNFLEVLRFSPLPLVPQVLDVLHFLKWGVFFFPPPPIAFAHAVICG